MTAARDEVLARIRTALAGSAPSEPVARTYRGRSDLPAGDPRLLDRFAERVADYKAVVRRTGADGLAEAVAGALTDGLSRRGGGGGGGGRQRIVVPAGVPAEWLSAADVEVVPDDDLDVATLDAVAGVVTGAAVGIAETGTIVLDASSDQGRRAITLVPDLHVCVVRADQVVAGVPDAIAVLDPTRPQTWISGPSATSDIELDRIEGVHGPRTLEVVLVDPDTP